MATPALSDHKKLARNLWEAVVKNNVNKVTSLLEQGADPNHQLYWSEEWRGRLPPLHRACLRGYLDIVNKLVNHGARTDKSDRRSNRLPLHYACEGGHKEVVVFLINEVGCNHAVRDSNNKTPLHYACQSGNKDLVQYLVEEVKCDVAVRDDDSCTPLHDACERGYKDLVQYLVEEVKCDVDVRDRWGDSPLDRALECEEWHTALYLINHGCDSDKDKVKLLCTACTWGKLDVVKELIEKHRMDPNVRDKYHNRTSLHHACNGRFIPESRLKLVQYLVEEAGSDISVTDKYGKTPFDIATRCGRTDIADYLRVKSPSGTRESPSVSTGVTVTSSSPSEKSQHGTQLTEEEVDGVQRLFRENSVEVPTGLDSLSFEQVTMFLRAHKRDDLADNLRTKLDEGMARPRACSTSNSGIKAEVHRKFFKQLYTEEMELDWNKLIA